MNGTAVHIPLPDRALIDPVMAVMDAAFDPQFGELWTRTQLESVLTLPHIALCVLYDAQDRLTAFTISRTLFEECELMMIAVLPAFQGKGHARKLMLELEEQCRTNKVESLFLEVRSNNPAKLFYESRGFAVIGQRKSYYKGRNGQNYDAITMKKSL